MLRGGLAMPNAFATRVPRVHRVLHQSMPAFLGDSNLVTAPAPVERLSGGDTSNHYMSTPKQRMKLRSNVQENRQPSIRDTCRDTLMVVSNCRRMAVSGEWLLFVPFCFVQRRNTLMVVSDCRRMAVIRE